jgi:hypothetical protein
MQLQASPINFAPAATAVRLDGQLQGVQINGYLVADQLRPTTTLLFFFLQSNSGSSQEAFVLFQRAQQKAQQRLPS